MTEAFEAFCKEMGRAIDDIRAKRIVNGKIKITRFDEKEIELSVDEEGECLNSRDGEPRPKVKAGDQMCGVGVIRRGRDWGDYSGVFCADCPYYVRSMI